ncbi:hypothetical protein Agub_g9234, partial [Astrephomene gubernaculifera]
MDAENAAPCDSGGGGGADESAVAGAVARALGELAAAAAMSILTRPEPRQAAGGPAVANSRRSDRGRAGRGTAATGSACNLRASATAEPSAASSGVAALRKGCSTALAQAEPAAVPCQVNELQAAGRGVETAPAAVASTGAETVAEGMHAALPNPRSGEAVQPPCLPDSLPGNKGGREQCAAVQWDSPHGVPASAQGSGLSTSDRSCSHDGHGNKACLPGEHDGSGLGVATFPAVDRVMQRRERLAALLRSRGHNAVPDTLAESARLADMRVATHVPVATSSVVQPTGTPCGEVFAIAEAPGGLGGAAAKASGPGTAAINGMCCGRATAHAPSKALDGRDVGPVADTLGTCSRKTWTEEPSGGGAVNANMRHASGGKMPKFRNASSGDGAVQATAASDAYAAMRAWRARRADAAAVICDAVRHFLDARAAAEDARVAAAASSLAYGMRRRLLTAWQ